MSQKNTKKFKKTDVSFTILILIGIIVVINFFSYQIFYRWDLTQNKVYSISKVTKRTVGGLDDVVNVKAYFSSNLPQQVLALKQEVADILDEYQNYSNGKIRVEFIDPGDDEDMKRELYMVGIPQLTFQTVEKDQVQVVNGYMGVAISFGAKTEAIPAIKRDASDLEYQLTTAIKKVTSDEIATIGLLTSHGPENLRDTISVALREVESLYTVQDVNLAQESAQVPANIDTLVIIGPRQDFNDSQLQAIDSFVMRGGSVLALVDGVLIDKGLTANKNNNALFGLLEKYGIKVNQDIVADVRNGMASFLQGIVTFSTNYPFWPIITNEGFNQENSAVANLESVLLPWASSITILEDKIAKESVQNLAFTTDKAWHLTENYNIQPNMGITPTGDRKQFSVAVSVNGELQSAFPQDEEGAINSNNNARMIVVGDSEYMNNDFLQRNPDNLTFFQNLLDSLSLDEDLISIRSKVVSSRPIKEGLSDTAKAAIRYGNVFGVTLIVILFGMSRYFLRRRSRFVDEI